MLSPFPADQVQSMLAVLFACQGGHLCRPDPPKPLNESKQMLSQKIMCLCVCVCIFVPEWLINWLVEKLHQRDTAIITSYTGIPLLYLSSRSNGCFLSY